MWVFFLTLIAEFQYKSTYFKKFYVFYWIPLKMSFLKKNLLPTATGVHVPKRSRTLVLTVNDTTRGTILWFLKCFQICFKNYRKKRSVVSVFIGYMNSLVSAVKNILSITFYDRFKAWAQNHTRAPGVLRIPSWTDIPGQRRANLLRC